MKGSLTAWKVNASAPDERHAPSKGRADVRRRARILDAGRRPSTPQPDRRTRERDSGGGASIDSPLLRTGEHEQAPSAIGRCSEEVLVVRVAADLLALWTVFPRAVPGLRSHTRQGTRAPNWREGLWVVSRRRPPHAGLLAAGFTASVRAPTAGAPSGPGGDR